jgi:HEPN domain-containing protein
MTKEDHVNYWISTAEKDWNVVQNLYNSKDYVYCLFFSHLVIEKLSKALWIKYKDENYPPRIHNIVYILEKANIEIEDSKKEFLLILNDFQLEGRYPDYQQKIYQMCTKERTDELLKTINEIKLWLLNNLQ